MALSAFYPAYNKVARRFKEGYAGAMSEKPSDTTIFRVTELSPRKPMQFDLRPSGATCDAVAKELGLDSLRKLRFAGELRADGQSDWRLEAKLGATVVQPCVISLTPVTTRIDNDVVRRFLATMPDVGNGEDDIEMPEDETIEPLGAEIDIHAVMTEALFLALPDYPRHPDASLEQTVFTAHGVLPMTDDDAKPFAGLAALRRKLENDE